MTEQIYLTDDLFSKIAIESRTLFQTRTSFRFLLFDRWRGNEHLLQFNLLIIKSWKMTYNI